MSKTVLFGAMGRHNLGDMLMPHVIQKLMPDTEFIVADLLERDMTRYGGHKTVSIVSLFDSDEPVNVIHLGGQVGACNPWAGLTMLSASQAEFDYFPYKVLPLAYLLPKSWFKNPGVFIANAIGGTSEGAQKILTDYDYVGFRDGSSVMDSSHRHVPDCVSMVKELFGDTIQDRDNAESIREMREALGDYVAVQVSAKILEEDGSRISGQIRKIRERTGLPIVFFCAGIAPVHDSLKAYVGGLPGMGWYFNNYDIWNLCNVIANAKLVIGTSLHVRLIASVYSVPRITFGDAPKVKSFVDEWDVLSSHVEIDGLSVLASRFWDDGLRPVPNHKSLGRRYMAGFNEWSKRWAT
jgi:hypothetical protein